MLSPFSSGSTCCSVHDRHTLLRMIRYATIPMTDIMASAAPMPMPALIPLDRPLGEAEGVEVASETAVAVLRSTADTSVVEEENVDTDVLAKNKAVLVAVNPSRAIENTVCRVPGAGATNCSFVGSSHAGLLFVSTPQHCHSPDVLFQVASGRNCDVHLFGKPGQRPELAVQPAT